VEHLGGPPAFVAVEKHPQSGERDAECHCVVSHRIRFKLGSKHERLQRIAPCSRVYIFSSKAFRARPRNCAHGWTSEGSCLSRLQYLLREIADTQPVTQSSYFKFCSHYLKTTFVRGLQAVRQRSDFASETAAVQLVIQMVKTLTSTGISGSDIFQMSTKGIVSTLQPFSCTNK
jgi:hypothetical protein